VSSSSSVCRVVVWIALRSPLHLNSYPSSNLFVPSHSAAPPASYGVQERSREGRMGPTWYAGEFKGGRRSGRGLGLWLSAEGFQEGLYEGEWFKVCAAFCF
jgi:hypothetical protein